MQGHGAEPSLRINWPALMAFKRTFTDPVPENREEGFRKRGIDTYHGRARFVNEETIEVDGEPLRAKHILLANGAKPAPLSFEGADLLTTSTEFLELDRLPGRVVFAGGGYISMEFAHVAARAGAEVTIVHRGERPLERFDPDLVGRLVGRTRALGITLHLHAEVTGVERQDGGFRVHMESGSGPMSVEADLVVHGAGRVPELDDMDLEAGGVARTRRGVTVNEYLQSVSNPRVYAAGDAADTEGLPLTPVASMDSHVVASNLLKGNHRTPDYRAIPTVVFTVPSLASVGLTEDEAHARGLDVAVHHNDITGWYNYRRVRAEVAAFKVLVDKATDHIVGAHLLGEGADELINVFTLAMRHDIPASALQRTIFAYPTHASDIAYML